MYNKEVGKEQRAVNGRYGFYLISVSLTHNQLEEIAGYLFSYFFVHSTYIVIVFICHQGTTNSLSYFQVFGDFPVDARAAAA